jgi:hypothetical protein
MAQYVQSELPRREKYLSVLMLEMTTESPPEFYY